jgi:nitrilase
MTSCANVARNLAVAGELLRQAKAQGAVVAALPENFAFMGRGEADKLAVAETHGSGPIQAFLAEQARMHGLWIVGGTFPLKVPDESRVAAACLVIDDAGREVARYDKIHLFDVDVPGKLESHRESKAVRPGTQVVTVDTPAGRLGLAI